MAQGILVLSMCQNQSAKAMRHKHYHLLRKRKIKVWFVLHTLQIKWQVLMEILKRVSTTEVLTLLKYYV